MTPRELFRRVGAAASREELNQYHPEREYPSDEADEAIGRAALKALMAPPEGGGNCSWRCGFCSAGEPYTSCTLHLSMEHTTDCWDIQPGPDCPMCPPGGEGAQ